MADAGMAWVLECSSCRLRFSSVLGSLTEDAYSWNELYGDDYLPYHKTPKRESSSSWPGRLLFDWMGRCFGESLPRPFGTGRSLEIGCASGSDLRRLVDLGWCATGIEPHHQAAERARRWSGARVLEASFPAKGLRSGSFDLIVAQQVLEHLNDPMRAGREMARLLRPGGLAYITVPNSESWGAKTFGAEWVGWDVPRHRTHFTKESLARWSRDSGLAVERMATLKRAGWIRQSARRGKGRKSACLSSRWGASLYARLGAWSGCGESLLLLARSLS